MKRPHTIIYIAPDGTNKKQFDIDPIFFKVIIGFVFFMFVVIFVSLVFIGTIYGDAIQKRVYADKVKKMEEEVRKVEQLKKDILYLYERNDKIKNLLGIDIQNSILKSHTEDIKTIKVDSIISLDSLKKDLSSVPDIDPTVGEISRKFSKEHPAVDIAASANTPVVATIDGIVLSVGWDENFGNYVKINNSSFVIFYGHLEKVFVKNLQIVKKGEIVGLVGNSGKSTAPHLHYEIMTDTVFVDPEKFLPKK